MTRTGDAAIEYARSRVGANAMPASGYCLAFVRECFDVGSYYPSAIDAWNASPSKHAGDRNPPPAVPLYFTTPSQYDHVVFGGSWAEIITTFNDDVRQYVGASGSDVIAAIERDFDGSFLGWTEDINGVTVYNPTAPPPEDDMPSAEEVAAAVWNYPIAGQGVGPGFGPGPAYSWLRDARNGAISVWDVPIGPRSEVGEGPGPGPARDWLADARNSAGIAVANTGPDVDTARSWSHELLVFALVVLLAVVGGVAVGLLADTEQGVVAGVAALAGGLLATVLRNLPGRSST